MRRTGFVLFALVALLAVTFAPAFAVTDGELDGDGHPYVMLLLMDVAGEPAYRCSGTLIAPQVFLTAGHCAGEPGEFSGMRVFTESDVQNGDNTYPFAGGPNSVEAIAWGAHPQYTSAQFFLHDVGVVILAEPIFLAEYGELPAINQLDPMKTQRGKQDLTFTAVGYGLQKSFPDATAWKESRLRIRMVAYPHLPRRTTSTVRSRSTAALLATTRSCSPTTPTRVARALATPVARISSVARMSLPG